jgi:hypothetical protein
MKLCIEVDIYFIPKFHILETGTVKLSIETGLTDPLNNDNSSVHCAVRTTTIRSVHLYPFIARCVLCLSVVNVFIDVFHFVSSIDEKFSADQT